MAVVTGTETGTGNGLTPQQRELVEKAKKPVDIANKFRLAFLFIGVVALLFVYFGNKAWEGIAWYDSAVQHIYQFLLWDIVLMLVSTIIKFIFVAKYNRTIKYL